MQREIKLKQEELATWVRLPFSPRKTLAAMVMVVQFLRMMISLHTASEALSIMACMSAIIMMWLVSILVWTAYKLLCWMKNSNCSIITMKEGNGQPFATHNCLMGMTTSLPQRLFVIVNRMCFINIPCV